MKSRILPFSLKALTLGTASLLLATASMAHQEQRHSDKFILEQEFEEATFANSIDNFNQKAKTAELKINKIDGSEWNALGPDNFSENISCILFDNKDSNSNTIYAGTKFGGLYKSFNNGISWEKINLNSDFSLNVSSIFQTSDGTVYVSTGYTSGDDIINGEGLYKSTNGTDFELILGTTVDANEDNSFRAINDLIVNEKTNQIYIATNAGLKYANLSDGNWKQAKDAEGNDITSTVVDLEISEEGSILAMVNFLPNPNSTTNIHQHVYKLNAETSQFTNLCTDEEGKFAIEGNAKIKIAFAKSNPQVCYAVSAQKSGRLNDLFRSNDGGETWAVIFPGESQLYNTLGKTGDISLFISVDPLNEDKIFFGSKDIWRGVKSEGNDNYSLTQISVSTEPTFRPNYVRSYINQVIFKETDSNEVFISTKGGIYRGDINKKRFVSSLKNLNSIYTNTVGFARDKNAGFISTNQNGALFVSGKANTDNFASKFDVVDSYDRKYSFAYFAQQSMLDPNLFLASADGERFYRYNTIDGTTDLFLYSDQEGVKLINNYNATPTIMYETVENYFPVDTIYYHNNWADSTIHKSTKDKKKKIAAFHEYSSDRRIPIIHELKVDLKPGDSIAIYDRVVNKTFVAGKNGVYMSAHVPYFDKKSGKKDASLEWWLIGEYYDKSNFKNPKPNALAISQDGNHAWASAHNKSNTTTRLTRISNLILANDQNSADVRYADCVTATTLINLPEGYSNAIISSISVDPSNSSRVMIIFKEHEEKSNLVFITENALAETPSFRPIGQNLPKLKLYTGIIEMTNPNIGFIGTAKGLYRSDDLTAESPTWNYVDSPFKQLTVSSIKQQTMQMFDNNYDIPNPAIEGDYIPIIHTGVNSTGTIYLGTIGNGAYISNEFLNEGTDVTVGVDNIEKESSIAVNIFPNPAVNISTIEINMQNEGDVNCAVYDMKGRLVLASTFTKLTVGKNVESVDLSRIPNGNYIISLSNGKEEVNSKIVISK